MNVLLKYFLSIIIILFGVLIDIGKAPDKNQAIPAPYQKPAIAKEIMMDVPLINQMDAPRLYNGCEVTSLAMLLQFWGIQVSKNELAEKIPRVPLKYSDGKNGNPNTGFVGNMEDGPGLGVYHGPVFELAQPYLPANLKVTDLTNHPFDTIIEKLNEGLPVWVITTSNFSPVPTIQSWTTPQGSVEITYNMHSAVITGYDHKNIYLNNPYGIKNQQVNKANFLKSWQQMGSQAIVVEPVKK
ncbi:hydrolase [Mesobacillus campisalis]|uniref:Hydrolase n=1 Tax=Mesobacillus campisalis TaxID=1408103 RepID=A0A0M2SUC9_9BACI|nr:C39 family peptidase [Mesobacillus campisalis]KKK36592.1 hydrolase [Mesobacillus campisalis]